MGFQLVESREKDRLLPRMGNAQPTPHMGVMIVNTRIFFFHMANLASDVNFHFATIILSRGTKHTCGEQAKERQKKGPDWL